MTLTRREMLRGLTAVGAAAATHGHAALPTEPPAGSAPAPLLEVAYEQVEVRGTLEAAQAAQARRVLLGLNENSLMKPFRQMAGRPAPGETLGGWYEWKPDFDFHHDDAGFAPASTFGQWTSAMARLHAGSRAAGAAADTALADRAVRLHGLLRDEITPDFFAGTRFPAYTYEKLVCGLVDAHLLAGDTGAWKTLERVTAAAEPSLPKQALERERQWALGKDASFMWDESYTLPENLYRAASAGAGSRYHRMARAYLEDETYFEPLARGNDALSDRHAYSYLNALCSAMQAYFVDGSTMHLRAARNAFAMVEAQSFVTGGWGPDELFRKPGYGQLAASLTNTHNSFEVPCGSFAHTKLTRYLLRATRDGRYGDSMERVIHNAALGSLPLLPDGHAFYYADYNQMAKRIYSTHRWPCCSGTQPQLAADYGINGYLREPGAVWVNLYQPSTLRWQEGADALMLEQTTEYPRDGRVQLRLAFAPRATPLRLMLRVPAWARGAAVIDVNGEPQPVEAREGFASVSRTWRQGDVLTLTLPMALRLEALPMNGGPMHLDTVALLRGPQVLFAVREPWESGPLSLSADALLGARQSGPAEWTVTTTKGARRFVPWTDLGDRMYSTYVKAI